MILYSKNKLNLYNILCCGNRYPKREKTLSGAVFCSRATLPATCKTEHFFWLGPASQKSKNMCIKPEYFWAHIWLKCFILLQSTIYVYQTAENDILWPMTNLVCDASLDILYESARVIAKNNFILIQRKFEKMSFGHPSKSGIQVKKKVRSFKGYIMQTSLIFFYLSNI